MTTDTAELTRAYGSGYRRALKDAQKAIEQRYRELRPMSQDWPLIVMDDLVDDAEASHRCAQHDSKGAEL